MEVAQEQAYEKRKLQLKQKRLSRQLDMAEGGKVVPDGGPQLYVPGTTFLPHLLAPHYRLLYVLYYSLTSLGFLPLSSHFVAFRF